MADYPDHVFYRTPIVAETAYATTSIVSISDSYVAGVSCTYSGWMVPCFYNALGATDSDNYANHHYVYPWLRSPSTNTYCAWQVCATTVVYSCYLVHEAVVDSYWLVP